MKKIFTLSCVVASLMTLGVVSSCKDYNEDLRRDIEATQAKENATIWEQLKKQQDALAKANQDIKDLKDYTDDEIAKLQQRIDKINECDCDITKTIAAVIGSDNFKTAVNALIDASYNDDAIKAQIQNIAESVVTASFTKELFGDGANPALTEALDKYIATYLEQHGGTTTPVGPSEEEIKALFDEWVANKGYITDLTAITNRLDALETAKTTIETNITNLNTLVNDLKGNVDAQGVKIGELTTTLTTINGDVNTLKSTVSSIESTVTTLSGDVTEMQSSIETLTNNLAAAESACQSGLAEAKKAIEDLDAKVDNEIKAAKAYAQTEIANALEGVKKDIADALYYATEYTDKMLAELSLDDKYVTLDIFNTTVGELNTAIATVEANMQQEINTINQSLDGVKEDVQELSGKLDVLTGRVDNLKARLDAQITSVIVQGVTTPMFFNANIALPVGVQSNILTAYYGSCVGGDFPKYDSFKDADGNEFCDGESMDDWDFTSKAGKVYFTINPSTIDFSKEMENKVLYLYDSKNQPSAVRLANVKKSSKLLQFGVTRAADNGFYEADAILNSSTASHNTFNISKSDLKDVAGDIKTLLKQRKGVKDLAVDVAKLAYHSMQLPAYAMGVPYRYVNDNNEEVEAFVYSNYGIATVAMQPLSYNLDLEQYTKKIPHKYISAISRVSDLMSGLTVKIEDALHFEFAEVNFELDGFDTDITIEIKPIELGTITLEDKEVTIDTNVSTDINASVGEGELNMDVNTSVTATTEVVTVTVPIDYTYEIPKFDEENKPLVNEKGEVVYEEVPVHLDIPVDIPAQTINGTATGSATNPDEVPVTGTATGHINETVVIPMGDIADQINTQVIKKVNDQINAQLEDMNVQLQKINDLTSSINKMSDKLNQTINDMLQNTASSINGKLDTVMDIINDLEGRGDNVIDRVNGYINRVNSLLDRVYSRIDNINYYLQPVLMAGISTSGISEVSNLPTYIKATSAGANYTNLYPTSYTAEILNPAYKKYVTVVAARDAQGVNHPDAVEFANKQKGMNKVIDGSTRSVVFGTNQKYAGLTYEIVYAALDYHGFQSTQHYYIKVVK